MRYTHNPVELQLRVSLLLGLFKNDIITSACDLIGPKHKNRSRMIRIRTWERWRKDLNSAGHTHTNTTRIKRQIRANSTPHMPHAHTRTCDDVHTFRPRLGILDSKKPNHRNHTSGTHTAPKISSKTNAPVCHVTVAPPSLSVQRFKYFC